MFEACIEHTIGFGVPPKGTLGAPKGTMAFGKDLVRTLLATLTKYLISTQRCAMRVAIFSTGSEFYVITHPYLSHPFCTFVGGESLKMIKHYLYQCGHEAVSHHSTHVFSSRVLATLCSQCNLILRLFTIALCNRNCWEYGTQPHCVTITVSVFVS